MTFLVVSSNYRGHRSVQGNPTLPPSVVRIERLTQEEIAQLLPITIKEEPLSEDEGEEEAMVDGTGQYF